MVRLAPPLFVFACVIIAAGAAEADGDKGRGAELEPVSAPRGLEPRKVALGRRLFSDTRLSADGTVSCATCHDLDRGGVDNRVVSLGVGGKAGDINTPTVFNSGLNFKQFWNGRADSLDEQIEGPLHNPLEMATDWPAVIAKLTQDARYAAAFRELYGKAPDATSIKDAIATFERALVTLDAPFDRHLRGDKKALSPAAKAGYDLFVELNCTRCHDGANVGGGAFERFGVLGKPPFIKKGRPVTKADLGRYALTKDDKDLYRFKVPGLRNVALTAPYFHDGSASTLADAVRTMAEVQLGLTLTDQQIEKLTAFLAALTGKPPLAARTLAREP